MKKNWVSFALVVILAIVLFLVKRCQNGGNDKEKKSTTTTRTTEKKETYPTGVNRNRGFDRRISYIEYTEHAKCRMQCRRISQAEVEEMMRDGKINYKKSDVNDRPCPTYALEGVTRDDQRVRIVFAQCDFKTKVVTCIDLDTDWECSCPGDDRSYQNQR